MGRSKELWIKLDEEKKEREEHEAAADSLGITYEELVSFDGWSIVEEETSDGMIRKYIIFASDSPRDILDKIDGIDNNNRFLLSEVDALSEEPDEFDDQEEDHDHEEA